ncbi:MAG: AAA family ATPase [Acidobacteriota bacterium]|nr:AAA family ATPase [Acidobacteriota bacterium]
MDVPVFSISANPSCMYMTKALQEATVRFRRAIARKQGLCCILGDNGLGKSSLLKFFASGYETDETCSVSYFSDSRKFKTGFEFLKMISADLEITPRRSQSAQMEAIEEFLVQNHRAGKSTLIFIDEAQRMNLGQLELVRAMLNYETDTDKLVQFVLSGQLNLRDRLLQPDHKAIRSRIVAPYLMTPLATEETIAMIQFRLDAWGVQNPFSREAMFRVHELTGGVPRDILLLCQAAYDKAADDQRAVVTPADVESASQLMEIRDRDREYAAALS